MNFNGELVRARRPGHDGHCMVVHHLLAAKIASKISAVVPAYHNNHGDPDHQTRTRPLCSRGVRGRAAIGAREQTLHQ